MTMKVECNNCHTEVVVNTPGMNGWLLIQQVVMFQQLGDQPPADGNFCTIACAIEFLQKNQPRMEEMDDERPGGGAGETRPDAGGGQAEGSGGGHPD